MKRWPINHLTADDLDAFHSASLSPSAREHLDECEACSTMARLDAVVLARLASLPSYAPGAAFADQVMARVHRPEPAVVGLFRPRSRAAWSRLAVAASVLVSIGASVVWSLGHQDLLLSWIHQASAETGRLSWLGVRVVATNLTAQPWYAPLRDFVASPGRLIALASGSLVAYAAALVALRRLLTPPTRPVPHAHG